MHERRILKLMDAGIIIAQGETLLGHAAMQHDERLRLVALLYSLISFFICLSPFSVQDILGVTVSSWIFLTTFVFFFSHITRIFFVTMSFPIRVFPLFLCLEGVTKMYSPSKYCLQNSPWLVLFLLFIFSD